MNNLKEIPEIYQGGNVSSSKCACNETHNTPTSDSQKLLLRNIQKEYNGGQQDEKKVSQYCRIMNTNRQKNGSEMSKMRSRAMSQNVIKTTRADFSDDHLVEKMVGNDLAVKVKESQLQGAQMIMRKSQTSEIKKRQRIISHTAVTIHQSQPNAFAQQLNNPIRPLLSASIKTKIQNFTIQQENSDKQQSHNNFAKDTEVQMINHQNSKKSLNKQLYIDIFVKKKSILDVASSFKDNNGQQIIKKKQQNQFVTPSMNQESVQQQSQKQEYNQQQQPDQNEQQHKYQLTSQQQKFQNQQDLYKQQSKKLEPKQQDDQIAQNSTDTVKLNGINKGIRNVLASSRPSSNVKLRSNDMKGKINNEMIDVQDVLRMQSQYQSIGINRDRSPQKNAYYYYSSQKVSRSNSMQNGDLKYFQSQSDQQLQNTLPPNLQKSISNIQKIFLSESILSKLNQPQCRHSHYLEVQDKIKEWSHQILEICSSDLESGNSIFSTNNQDFLNMFLCSLQKVFSEINSFISKIVIALPDQYAVDQMQNVKRLLEVILCMHTPNNLKNQFQTREKLNQNKLLYIQELSLLPSQSTLQFVELFNDLDKYFQIYQEQIEEWKERIKQQNDQIKEMSQMLEAHENNIQLKNKLHESQYQSNQLYYEKEEMMLKLNQSLEQNYTSRLAELKQVESHNTKEIDESKKHISQLNRQIAELKERVKVLSQKKTKVDQSTQIDIMMMIMANKSEKNNKKQFLSKLQRQIVSYPSAFRFSIKGVLGIISSILCEKVKDDYTCFISKQPYQALQEYTATWFMKSFGQSQVANAFLNDFIQTVQELQQTDRQTELFSELLGLTPIHKKSIDLQSMRANQKGNTIQQAIKQIALQSNIFYQVYYDIAKTYRKKLEEKSDNYNRPYFFHQYRSDELIPLKQGQRIVAEHLKKFLPDPDSLDSYLDMFMKIEFTQHIYEKTFKPFNYSLLKQNIDLLGGGKSQQFEQQLKKTAQITTSLSNIAQFVIDSIASIESERLLQFIYILKTSQLEKLNRQLCITDYIQVMQSYYPAKNSAFYSNSFALYCITDIIKVFDTNDEAQQIKYLNKFTHFVIDFRTQDSFYAQIQEGQAYESPSTSPHSPKKLRHSNSGKSSSHIKLENASAQNKNSQVEIDSPSKARGLVKSKTVLFQQNSLSHIKSVTEFIESPMSPSKKQNLNISNFHLLSQKQIQSTPQSPNKQGGISPKKAGQLLKRQGSLSPQKSQKSSQSPMRSQQQFFFSTRNLFRQEFENKAIDAFFKQHLNTFANIIIIEEVYNNLLALIKKEQQTEERIKQTHDSFKYYLATSKNQPYITANYISRHDFIQYVMNCWDELRNILQFLASAFCKQTQTKNLINE